MFDILSQLAEKNRPHGTIPLKAVRFVAPLFEKAEIELGYTVRSIEGTLVNVVMCRQKEKE